MSVIPPNNNTTLIIDDFINYATAHLSTVSGIVNTLSLYPPVAAPAPGVLPWTGYQVSPATPGSIAPPNPYEQLDWSQVPLDKNSPEVQEIIAPNLEQIQLELQNEPLVEYGNPDTYPIILEMDNVVAETLDTALYEQKILKTEPDTPEKKEEQKKLRYIYDLELNKSESELVALRNEKLEAEINHKNSELASSAMHLVKKGELVSKMKTELGHVIKGISNPQAEAELKKMIRSISEDDNMDQEWEHFTLHFDKVHSDFVSDGVGTRLHFD